MNRNPRVATFLGENWFLPVLSALLSIVWLQSRFLDPGMPPTWEAALLFDMIVTIPFLCWCCYRRSLGLGAMALRIVALQCSGLWLLGWIVPASEQHLLPEMAPLRSIGLAIIVLVEVRLVLILIRTVFKPATKPADLQVQGVPAWVARLMLLEVRFWRWLFGWFKR